MYQRIVCFKFKKDATEQTIQHHLDSFKALKQQIPQIVSYHGGRTISENDQPPEYDSMHDLTYATQEDIDVYFHHDAHQRFIQDNKTIWEKVLVLDAAIDE